MLLRLTGVTDCAVFGIPDARVRREVDGGGQNQSEGSSLTPTAIQAHLTHHLGRLQGATHHRDRARPAAARISGKIFKRRLRDPFWHALGRKI